MNWDRATENLSRLDRSTLFQNIFGILGRSGSLTISQNPEQFFEFVDNLGQAAGTARNTSELIDGGIGGSIRRVISALEGLREQVGSIIAIPVAPVLEELRNALNSITEFAARNPELVQGVAGFGAALLGVGTALTVFAAVVGGSLIVLNSFLAIVGSVVGVLGFLASSLLTIPGAITAVTVALIGLNGGFAAVRDAGLVAGDELADGFLGAFNTIRTSITSIVEAFQNQDWQGAGRVAGLALEIGIRESLASIRNAIFAFIDDLAESFENQIPTTIPEIDEFLFGRFDRLGQSLINAGAQIGAGLFGFGIAAYFRSRTAKRNSRGR